MAYQGWRRLLTIIRARFALTPQGDQRYTALGKSLLEEEEKTIAKNVFDYERVVIFIDGSNLYHALEENCHRADLDFGKFSQRLAGDRPLVRTYYYNIQQDPTRNPEGAREQQKFLDALANTPYMEVRLGTTKQREGVTVERGVDIMLATDLLDLAWHNAFDAAILVSGDGDFIYAVQRVKELGKHMEVAAFESNASRDLLQTMDRRHSLTTEFFRDLWIGGPQRDGGRRYHRRRGRPRHVRREAPGSQQATPPQEEVSD
jgi:uncharacterized LabA/DUF88 family protein